MITHFFDVHVSYTIDFNKTNSNNAFAPDYRNQVFQIGFGIKLN